MSTITKLEVNLSKKYIEPEEGSEEWCKDHLEDPRCEQYRPVDPVNPTPEPQQDAPNTGYFTSQTDDNHTVVNQSQISAIFFGGFCLLLILAFVLPKLINKINKNRKNHYNLKKAPVFNKFRIASFALAILSLGAGIITAVEAYERGIEKEVTASAEVTINAEILGTDEIAYVHDQIKVPASNAGFSLYITSKMTDLVDIYNSTYTIKSITESGKLSNNTYGVYVGKDANDAPTSETVFNPIYAKNKQLSIFSTDSSEAQTVDVWYAVRSKDNKEAIYATDLEIKAISHENTMQEMTGEFCADLDIGVDYEFVDERDGKKYTIGKYLDGNCWMKENLALNLSTDRVLTSEDTDLPDGESWTPLSDTAKGDKQWNSYSRNIINRWYYNETHEYGTGPVPAQYDDDKISVDDQPSYEIITDNDGNILEKKVYEYDQSDDETVVTKTYDSEGNEILDFTIKDDELCFVRTWDGWWNYDKINTSKCIDHSYESGDQGFGNYYDLAAATAGTAQFEYIEDKEHEENSYYQYKNETASICPANWHMATTKDYQNLYGYYMNLEFDDEYMGAYANINDVLPEFGPFGMYGYIDEYIDTADGEHYMSDSYDTHLAMNEGSGKQGIYAPGLMTVDEIYQGSHIFVTESYELLAKHPDAKLDTEIVSLMTLYGMSIRCVANYTPTATIIFDSGIDDESVTVTGIPEKQKLVLINGETKYTLPSTIPTRSDGYEFIGWATSEADANENKISYYAGQQIIIKGAGIKLYAVWDDPSIIREPYAVKTENNILTFVYTKEPIHEGDDFITFDGTTSKITNLYEVPKENKLEISQLPDIGEITGAGSPNLDAISNMVVEGSKFAPEWAFKYQDDECVDNCFVKYEHIAFDSSFASFRPESTAFWFLGITNVKSIEDIIYLNTSEVQMMSGMFMCFQMYDPDEDNLFNLTSRLDVSHFNTSQVKSMYGMFAFNINGKTTGVENFDTRSLEDTRMMFAINLHSELSTIDLSNWDMSKVKQLDYMFFFSVIYEYDGLIIHVKHSIGNIIQGIDKWNISSATSLNGTFMWSLLDINSIPTINGKATLDLTNWDVSNVTSMNHTFAIMGVGNILSDDEQPKESVLDLSGWNTSNVESMAGMFFGSMSTEIYLLSSNKSGTKTNGWNLSGLKVAPDKEEDLKDEGGVTSMFSSTNVSKIYSDKDWAVPYGVLSEGMFDDAENLIGGNNTKYDSNNTNDIKYARVDREGIVGYFTNPNINTAQIIEDILPQPLAMMYVPYDPSVETTEESTDESETETPVSTGEEKKSTKKSDTKSEQTEPLGVKKSVEQNSTVDTATVAVIVASFVLVSAGAVIIFLIEKRRNEDEE